MSAPDDKTSEVFFEFAAIGRSVKVSAIHKATGIEVSVVGPASASRADLQQVALRKLLLRLKRES
ncbi:MAG: hypothetical protein QOG83_3335 [Alphaproteobacteria bacterium]|nr:hypothetical protein [Alphaproteobacteria bacterium]MEA2938878.1 hypothetical protein [Alphaproteobacteria bacterium]MEA2990624.1 hypothetical protein [Alphaproteobacteria bacterium]